jgi:hypothetical protein
VTSRASRTIWYDSLARDYLIDLLWENLEPDAAANNLRKAIHIARHALEPGLSGPSRFLHIQGDMLLLKPEMPRRIPWLRSCTGGSWQTLLPRGFWQRSLLHRLHRLMRSAPSLSCSPTVDTYEVVKQH